MLDAGAPGRLAEPICLAEQYALPFLPQGRTGWDEPHTRAVVYYAERLAAAAPVDVVVAVTTAWLHDIGYAGLFADADPNSHAVVKSRKARHMERGAELARAFVERPDVAPFYSAAQRERVIHLVGVHDKIRDLAARDEIVFMEADTLGALDTRRVTPTYDYENGMRHLEEVRTGRARKFQTALGKRYLDELLALRVAYFESLRSTVPEDCNP